MGAEQEVDQVVLHAQARIERQGEKRRALLRVHAPHADRVRPGEDRGVAAADLARPEQGQKARVRKVPRHAGGGAQVLHGVPGRNARPRRLRAGELEEEAAPLPRKAEAEVSGVLVVQDAEHAAEPGQEREVVRLGHAEGDAVHRLLDQRTPSPHWWARAAKPSGRGARTSMRAPVKGWVSAARQACSAKRSGRSGQGAP